jgi:hypothetical protein
VLISVLSPLCEMRPQNHLVSVPQPHTPQGRAAAASANCNDITPDKLLSMAAQLKGKTRGRPRLTEKEKEDRVVLRTGKKPKLRTETRLRTETPDAKTRMCIVKKFQELAAERDAAVQPCSRRVFLIECQRKFGIPAAMLKRIASAGEVSKLENWLAMEDKRQSKRGNNRFWEHFISKDQGIRLGKHGVKKKTFASPFEAEEEQLKSWIRREEELGHGLEVTDLIDEFILILESQVYDMQEKKEALGGLPEADEKKQRLSINRLSKLTKPHNKKYLGARLLYACNFVTRRPHNVVPYTTAENDCICKLSWQSWDWLTHVLATGTAAQLKTFMCEPDIFIQNRKSLVIVGQDATPVYLDLSTGKMLVRGEVLDACNLRRAAKKARDKNRNISIVTLTGSTAPSDAQGSSRREKNRLTLILRQSLHGVFDPDVKVPEGRIRDAVLFNPCREARAFGGYVIRRAKLLAQRPQLRGRWNTAAGPSSSCSLPRSSSSLRSAASRAENDGCDAGSRSYVGQARWSSCVRQSVIN